MTYDDIAGNNDNTFNDMDDSWKTTLKALWKSP